MSFSLEGAIFVGASSREVWAGLHDSNILSSCVPGCRFLRRVSDQAFELGLTARLGPLQIAFDGAVEVTESHPPYSYSLRGRGAGSIGRAHGCAKILIKERSGGCLLTYSVQAETGGLLAAAGPVVLATTGKALSLFFSRRFRELVGNQCEHLVPQGT